MNRFFKDRFFKNVASVIIVTGVLFNDVEIG